jgi:Subtilisin inhibitor-like
MSWPRTSRASFLAALALAGCGEASPEGSGDAPESPAPATELTITFQPQGEDGEAREATLTCDPPGGTHPAAETACEALASQASALEPTPGDAVCLEVFGGPQTAKVRGTVVGETVSARFSRENGCEIDRWDALEPVLRFGG